MLDGIVDPGSWAEIGAADGAFGPAGLDLAGSTAAADGSWASVDTSLTDAVNNLIYQPIHNLGEWWITSPLTSELTS
ncbi:MAG TPA: hypothetical protein VFR27_01400 [Mycobacterium sp.]|nr:hypothetical protein [Mycobacterium sp.]